MELYKMGEELIQKGLNEHGLIIGNYEFYNIGNTTLNQLKKYKIIPNKEYKENGARKPDSLLVDRRNKKDIKVILVMEHKYIEKFKSENEKTEAVQQCNDLCQVLDAEIGIATDGFSFIWFNPIHYHPKNAKSYTLITDEKGNNFIKEFIIDQKTDEQDITKLNVKTKKAIQNLELLRKSISATNSQIIKEVPIDPTNLAKQIWQDVWSVTGATPERCLYTFVELFIFKYLSDLNILTEDDKGNKINFKDIFALHEEKGFC
jgi:type I restriction enzyme M protein